MPRDATPPRDNADSDSDSPSPSSNTVRIAFYDSTSYFHQSFTQVTHALTSHHQLPFTPEFKFISSRLTPDTVDLARHCPIICIFVSDKADRPIARSLHSLGVRLICLRAAGFNNVDIGACDEVGITVARVPAYSPYAVAEFATALLLSLNRKVHHAYARVRDYNFSLDRLVGFDMRGKTVGVLGTGKIGQCFIEIMLGFGCHVLCYDIQRVKALENKKHVKYVELDELCKSSDLVSLHLPLVPETKHIINAKTLSLMKPTALIINTGRGELVNTEDLLRALRAEKIGGAGLDVYEEEGEYFYADWSELVMKDRELLEVINQPNCLVTSHQAFLTREALEEIGRVTLENVKEFVVDGKRMGELKNSINKKGGQKEKEGGRPRAQKHSKSETKPSDSGLVKPHSTGASFGQQQHGEGVRARL